SNRLGLYAEVVPDKFPSVAGLFVDAERGRRLVAAMHHAVLTTRIASDAVDYAVFVPIHFRQHLLIAGVVAVGHEVAGGFPAFDVAGRDRPRGAMQVTLAGEELQIDRAAEERVLLSPVDDVLELLAGDFAGKEEI